MKLVKVLWQHQGLEEATWEHDDMMRITYPFLFEHKSTLFSHLIMKITVAYACDSMYTCVGISGQNSFKGGRMYNPGKMQFL